MAKTKKAKKASKITNEELNDLQKLVNSINQSYIQIGQVETQKHNLLHGLAGLNDQLVLMRDKFKKNYSTDDIIIADGTINYNEIN